MEKWNAQRAKAVAHALLKVLYPIMVKELRIKLLEEAKEHVLQVCSIGLSCNSFVMITLGLVTVGTSASKDMNLGNCSLVPRPP